MMYPSNKIPLAQKKTTALFQRGFKAYSLLLKICVLLREKLTIVGITEELKARLHKDIIFRHKSKESILSSLSFSKKDMVNFVSEIQELPCLLLQVSEPNREGIRFVLIFHYTTWKSHFLIGSDSSASVYIPDQVETINNHHGIFSFRNQVWRYLDLKSAYGSWLKVNQKQFIQLQPGFSSELVVRNKKFKIFSCSANHKSASL